VNYYEILSQHTFVKKLKSRLTKSQKEGKIDYMKKSAKRTLKVISTFGLCILISIVAGGIIFSRLFIQNSLEPLAREAASDLQTHHGAIIDDINLLESNPIFSNASFEKDALPFLMKHISWSDENETSKSLVMILKEAYPKFMSEPEQFESLLADSRVYEIELNWVDELENYDHLGGVEAHPKTSESLKSVPHMDSVVRVGFFYSIPTPRYDELQFASMLRLLQLHKSGHSLAGFRLMRKVTELLNSAPNLVAAQVAAKSLKWEHMIVERLNTPQWAPVDQKVIAAYRRLSWAWPSIIHALIWSGSDMDLMKYMKPQNGVCAAAGDVALGLGFEDLLEPQFIFELSFDQELMRSREIRQKLFNVCSLNEYEIFLTFARDTSKRQSLSSWQLPMGLHPSQIPYLRRHLGFTLMTVATPNFFRFYEKQQ
jgi:hypothetical protein